MATKGSKFLAKREVARLVTENRQPCVFCNQDVDEEVIFGKLYSYGDIQCHYFCVLLSCCLVQKGRDSEGLFGFLYKDILAEVERSKKHKCSYCGRVGASLGCAVSACRKQFHLPCGRRKNAVSLFYGNYKSFCELHAPKQKISEDVMQKAKERMKLERLIKAGKIPISDGGESKQNESSEDPAQVCVICYEEVQAYPTTQTFWPPCCGRDAWLHRACLQRMALSAGMHYLKCPLCNDKDNFYDAVCDQGYYLPDRDAAWELEQNAFSEIYDRDVKCAAADCKCPFGRGHDELGMWDIKLCLLCGSWGMHAFCSGGERPVCVSCRPAANDIDQLETRLTEVIMAEQARERERARSGPVMPSRMSLRRTKGRVQLHSASSSSQILPARETQTKTESQPTSLDVNIKPKPKLLNPNLKDLESKLLSPMKLLEQTFHEKGGAKDVVVSNEVVEKIRLKFSKPRPLSVKKKIVNEILDDLFKNVFKETPKSKDPIREWNSPKKSCDIAYDMNQAVKKNLKPLFNTIFKTEESRKIDEGNKDAENVKENLAQKEKTTKLHEDNDFQHVDDNENNLERDTNKLDDTSDKENDLNRNNGNLNGRDTENRYNDNDNAKSDDESSRSTFQLPPEFVADSNDSSIIDSPKKLKNADDKQDSNDKLKNEVVDAEKFIKILTESKINNKKSFQFSPLDKDVNSEVTATERDCNINSEQNKDRKNGCKKRKLEMKDGVTKKRKKEDRKHKEGKDGKKRKNKLKIKMVEREKGEKRSKIKMKKLRKKLVKDKNVRVKIKLKDDTECKIKKCKKHKFKSYKQYVLKYSPIESKVIAKPEVDVTPFKRKYTKIEKSPSDNLVQTSIQSFFKVKQT